jgi:hypothetical protein
MTRSANDIDIDPLSFSLGMINCFVEMVACGVKRLALSPQRSTLVSVPPRTRSSAALAYSRTWRRA